LVHQGLVGLRDIHEGVLEPMHGRLCAW
jgi:hypothetical protein